MKMNEPLIISKIIKSFINSSINYISRTGIKELIEKLKKANKKTRLLK